MDIDKQILEYLQTIPAGKVSTYKNVWLLFWVHPRKVAMVMKMNKKPDIYPCYKIVSASWTIWWYSAYDGVNSKKNMLEKDGVKITNWKIEEKYII